MIDIQYILPDALWCTTAAVLSAACNFIGYLLWLTQWHAQCPLYVGKHRPLRCDAMLTEIILVDFGFSAMSNRKENSFSGRAKGDNDKCSTTFWFVCFQMAFVLGVKVHKCICCCLSFYYKKKWKHISFIVCTGNGVVCFRNGKLLPRPLNGTVNAVIVCHQWQQFDAKCQTTIAECSILLQWSVDQWQACYHFWIDKKSPLASYQSTLRAIYFRKTKQKKNGKFQLNACKSTLHK